MTPLDRSRLHEHVLELLEKRHGVGIRASGVSAGMGARLDRALDALAEDGARSVSEVLERLRADPARLEAIADALRVGETRFYRDATQWEALQKQALPRLAEHDRLRGLSVGCSTGEEAWTLAIVLAEACARSKGRSYRVVGMDRSEAALETARNGVYPRGASRDLPHSLAERHLRADGEQTSVSASLRSCATFVLRDAMIGPPPGSYEVIICKNVLIYFGDDAAERVLGLLMRALAEDGLLVVAKSEVPRVRALGHRADEIAPGVSVFRS
jgi:chemotaxis protein methyltransferase CheR